MSKVLVTGGAGYIGSVAVAILLDSGYEVSVLDDFSTGHKDAVDSRAKLTQGSILDAEAIHAAIDGSDSVMHFAGKSLVGESVEKPDLYMRVNVEGTRNLLNVMKASGVKKIVFSSSASTYGEPKEVPILESAETKPTNPYGQSKLAVDQLLADRAQSDDLAAISLRYFNVAGAYRTPTGWLKERHNPETHLIPNVLQANSKNPLKVFGADWPTPDGTCIRDYVHVVDLIEAHIKALEKLEQKSHQVINLGSGDGYSVRQVVSAASEVVGSDISTEEVGRRAGDPAVLVASIQKAQSFLNWTPTRDINAMIKDAYASMKN